MFKSGQRNKVICVMSWHGNEYHGRVQPSRQWSIREVEEPQRGRWIRWENFPKRAAYDHASLIVLTYSHDYLSAVSPTHHSTSQPHALLWSSHQACRHLGFEAVPRHHLGHRSPHFHQGIHRLQMSCGLEVFVTASVLRVQGSDRWIGEVPRRRAD